MKLEENIYTFEQYIELLKFYIESGIEDVIEDDAVPRIPMQVIETIGKESKTVLSLSHLQNLDDLKQHLNKNNQIHLKAYADHTFINEGNEQGSLCVILPYPLRKNDEMGMFLLPGQKRLLSGLISTLGLKEKDIYYIYTVFYPPVLDVILQKDVSACIPYVERILDILKFKKVLVLSQYFYEYVLQSHGALLKDHGGNVYEDGRTYFLGFSFHMLLKNPRLKSILWNDIKIWHAKSFFSYKGKI